MIANDTVTVYNKAVESGKEVYYRTVLQGVGWEDRRAVERATVAVSQQANSARVHVPFIAFKDKYTDPVVWAALEDKTGLFTLQDGDIIAKGEVLSELSEQYTPSMLKKDYSKVLVIASVDDFMKGSDCMKYWLVGAK